MDNTARYRELIARELGLDWPYNRQYSRTEIIAALDRADFQLDKETEDEDIPHL